MATLATLAVKLIGDVAGFKKDFDGAEKTATGFADKMGKVGEKLSGAGAKLGAAVTLPVIALFNEAIDKASDLSETTSKIKTVFGEQGDAMLAWGKTSAQAMGMPAEAALSAAGTYGNLFRSMGMTETQSADMSKSIVQLAADLGSFNNMETPEVLEKLRAGLTGETEPLKTLGVNINASAIELEAMAMGLIKTKDEMTPAIKAQATYALILKQTTLAQGDFAKTSDGLANSQRIANAQLQNGVTMMGEHLLPIKLALVNAVLWLLGAFNGLSPEMQRIILIVMGVAAAIGPLLMVAGSLASGIAALTPVFTAIAGVLTGPVLLAIGAVIAVAALLYWAWQNNFMGIRDKAAEWYAWLQQLFVAVVAFIVRHMGEIQGAITSVLNIVRTGVQLFTTVVGGLWTAFTQLLKGDTSGAMETLRTTFSTAWILIQQIWQNAKTYALNVLALLLDGTITQARAKLQEVKQTFINKWNETLEWMRGLPTMMATIGHDMIQGLIDSIRARMDAVAQVLREVVEYAIKKIKQQLGIASPSKVFAGFGMNMMQGWANGITKYGDLPMAALGMISGEMAGPEMAFAGASGAGEPGVNGQRIEIHVHNPQIRSNADIDDLAAEIARRLQKRG